MDHDLPILPPSPHSHMRVSNQPSSAEPSAASLQDVLKGAENHRRLPARRFWRAATRRNRRRRAGCAVALAFFARCLVLRFTWGVLQRLCKTKAKQRGLAWLSD